MALQIDISYLTSLAILGVTLTFQCSIAMKGCICIGLANYLGILRNGGIRMIFIHTPVLRNNRPWYIERGRYGLAKFIYHLNAITPVASTFGLLVDGHLVYLFVLRRCILEYGLVFIASSRYAWYYVYVHLAACAIFQYPYLHRDVKDESLVKYVSYLYRLMNWLSIIKSLEELHIWCFFSVFSLEGAMVYNHPLPYINTYLHLSRSYLLICFGLSSLYCMHYHYYSPDPQTYSFLSELLRQAVTVLIILHYVN